MLNIKMIRQNPDTIATLVKTKDPSANIPLLLEYDESLRNKKTRVEELKAIRNSASKKIGECKRSGADATEFLEQVATYAEETDTLDKQIAEIEKKFTFLLSEIPNIPMEDVPVSPDPANNVVVREYGQKPVFSFETKNHLEINDQLNLFDFERGAKLAGAGWPAYRGMGARLEWALLQYMLDYHASNGYTQWFPPLLVKEEIMVGAGQLPKFAGQQYKIDDKDYNFYLIPTSEVSLNGLHMDEILNDEDLPLRYCAYTPCFRREAGAAGEKERGLIRVHQFNKVEMYCFTRPEESTEIFEEMVGHAEKIVKGLGLHYRSTLLVTGDMSFASAKTIDVEVWLPGQDRYYEVSSISNCTDYQARRSKIRFRRPGEKPEFIHTLNGSGLATSRLMVALIENNQNADGSINIPEVLRKYLGGLEVLKPETKTEATVGV